MIPRRRGEQHTVTEEQAERARAACGGGPDCFTCRNFVQARTEQRSWWEWLGRRWKERAWTVYA